MRTRRAFPHYLGMAEVRHKTYGGKIERHKSANKTREFPHE